MKMTSCFFRIITRAACVLVLATAMFSIPPVSALPDQTNFEAYLGDTIDLHGVAYAGSRLYLFITGPGLPSCGVTLTDTTQRTDQGHFTIVDTSSDQTWFMKWNTDRIRNQINPGTYKLYVSTSPSTATSLSGSYKEMTIYLKDPGPRNGVSVSAGKSYTLNPEAHVYTRTETPTMVPIVLPTTEPVATVTTTLTPDETTHPLPTTKSSLSLVLPVIAITAIILGIVAVKRRDS